MAKAADLMGADVQVVHNGLQAEGLVAQVHKDVGATIEGAEGQRQPLPQLRLHRYRQLLQHLRGAVAKWTRHISVRAPTAAGNRESRLLPPSQTCCQAGHQLPGR